MVYGGKNGTAETGGEGLGLGHRVVTSLLECVANPSYHEVRFDNFFTSYDLLVAIQDMNFRATGTARENRLKKCPLLETKLMEKKERGVYDVKCK